MATKNEIFFCIGRAGGLDGYLDDIDGNDISGGDAVLVVESDGQSFFYRCDASSGASENDPAVITPDSNPGTKRWILQDDIVQRKNLLRKNLLINGAMRIAQRGTSFSGLGNGDNATYTLDRWAFAETGTPNGVVTIAQVSELSAPEDFPNQMSIDTTTAESAVAADELIMVYQNIEAQDLQHLKYGQSDARDISLSFWLRSDKTGTMGVGVYAPDATRSYITEISISNTNWNKYEITIPGQAGTSSGITNDNGAGLRVHFTLVGGSNWQGTPDQWNSANYCCGSNQTNFLDAVGNTIYLTGVQLEIGKAATEFEHLPYHEELKSCQRYYERWDDVSSEVVGAGMCDTTDDAKVVWKYAVPKRSVNPTIGWSNLSNMRMQRPGTQSAVSAMSTSYAGEHSVQLDVTIGSASFTAGDGTLLVLGAASCYIDCSDEI